MSTPLEIVRAHALLWARITIDAKPDVSLMITTLGDMGVQMLARPSGTVCLQTLAEHADEIERTLHARLLSSELSSSAPAPLTEQDTEEKGREATTTTREVDPVPFDERVQCENTLLAEAKERLISCVMSSFRTDAGIIMLENDLIMFEDVEPEAEVGEWVVRMRSEWTNRLHSSVVEDFEEALDLWVLSQQRV